MSSDFEKLFDNAASFPHLKQFITTNGLLINKKWAKKLVNSNVSITYSIDGINKKTYESIRKGADYGQLIKGLDYINECLKNSDNKKFNSAFNFVVLESNYKEAGKLPDFAKKYNFNSIHLMAGLDEDMEQVNHFVEKYPEIIKYLKIIYPDMVEVTKKYGISLHSQIPLIKENNNENNTDNSKDECKKMHNLSVINTSRALSQLPLQKLNIFPKNEVRICSSGKIVGYLDACSLEELRNNKVMQNYRKRIYTKNSFALSDRCLSCIRAKEASEFKNINF